MNCFKFKNYFLFVFLLFFLACKKSENSNQINNNEPTTEEQNKAQNSSFLQVEKNLDYENTYDLSKEQTNAEVSNIQKEKSRPQETKSAEANSSANLAQKNSNETPANVNKENWLAQLMKISSSVDYRLREESLWRPASKGIYFERFDGLQTQKNSNAEVQYKSGTQLDLRENTLVIFDKDPGLTKKTKHDRVIVKSGELAGSTTTELWVFTKSGLVQIKSNSKQKKAVAQISLKKENKLKLNLNSGSAQIIYPNKENKYEKISVTQNTEVEIPIISENQKTINFANEKESEVMVENLTKADAEIKAATQAELIIEFPQDDFNTDQNQIELKGKLTALGAKILINGELTEANSDLSFTKKINLNEGTNIVVMQLLRSNSTSQFYRKTIKYMKAK